ncbi:nucleoprotein [Actinidia chinensis var. chinensis]|uniref:Nucleoprotein n=1 Tax=Actinidia chinensis var. chinensis TaxID=1590841 RepID=A0A2R6QI64_ACTCC|nr:nucleoprotein [Actinidia chinensis var. chinensis]
MALPHNFILKQNADGELEVGIDSTNEWKDEDLLGKEKLHLVKLEDLETDLDRVAYIQHAIDCLCKQVSRSSVGALITLAWNMVSPDDTRRAVFARNEAYVEGVDKAVSTLSKEVIQHSKSAPAYNLPRTYEKRRRAVAYVAGSALRLLTKPAENYVNTFGHITRAYRNFYREDFPIEMSLDEKCVTMTKNLLERMNILKNSIIPFLYHFDELEGGDKRMCKTLFEQHLSYTGIHAYPLFLTAAEKLELEANELIALLHNRLTRNAVGVIQHILNEYDFSGEREGKHAQRTWKYARVFNERVFAELQTKHCAVLVTVLAYLNRMLGTSGGENVLRIKQIEHIVQTNGSLYETVAKNIYEWAVGRKERPEGRTDEWKTTESFVLNFIKERGEQSGSKT